MKFFFTLFLLSFNLFAETKIDLLLQHGNAVLDRKEANNDRITELIWCGNQHIVYLTDNGVVNCFSLKDKKSIWSKSFKNSSHIKFSYNMQNDHVAITEPFLPDRKVHIIEVKNGKEIKSLKVNSLWKKTVGPGFENWAFFLEALYLPDNQGLLLKYQDQNQKVKFLKLSQDYSIAEQHKSILMGEEKIQGKYAVDVRNSYVRTVSLDEKKELLVIGKLPKKNEFVIGPEFYSHGFTDGKKLILSKDGGCFGSGSIDIYTIPSKRPFSFTSNCHHMEIAVNFEQAWIAVTGTNKDLVLFNFKGTEIALVKETSKQRNLCIGLSPNGKLLAIGSWDTTLKVYEVK